MKKIMMMMATILALCGVLFIGSKQLSAQAGATTQANTLNLYNWGDYIDPALLKKFEKQTGYHVQYETFDSNEAMFTKIKQGGTAYDLAIPSDYMIEKMKKAKLLLPIDQQKLSNFKYLDQHFLDQSFDRGNRYSIPYFWGTLGIIYNDQQVKASEVQHWDDLWAPKWQNDLMLVDSARDILGMTLISQGQSVNTTDTAILNQASRKLDRLSINVKAIVADEIKTYMIQNEAPLAVTWSGEAAEMIEQNQHLHYVVPSEGSNAWYDNMVIPKTAKHQKAAYAFINFMLAPENAAQNAEYVGYATPNKAAKALLPRKIRDDRQFYPPLSTVEKLEVYQDLGATKVEQYNDLFLKFKMYRQ
ncbi:ABC transporter substrate-binding protein [Lapidilactobacillus achengensis]|uniref:ABC transporter substrate-binding protein n=1 Tax=Lapidilactobacillus achengensis TaxID=2486000 RepID=A0ABW1UNS5_9LACO|nr:ABC transporter substrate-binding protein [Lapidilactobacillus achengensis]